MSLLPAASELNSARVELMHKLEWKNAVILYETSTGTIFDRVILVCSLLSELLALLL